MSQNLKRIMIFLVAVSLVCSMLPMVALADETTTVTPEESVGSRDPEFSGGTEPVPGDMNGDGAVNVDDVIALLLHVSMPDRFSVNGSADLDENGRVNLDDAITLLLQVSFP